MHTIQAAEANRQFSAVLKRVSQGEEFLVLSRRKPVATISPVRSADSTRLAARQMLFERLRGQRTAGVRTWTRDELYERTPGGQSLLSAASSAARFSFGGKDQ